MYAIMFGLDLEIFRQTQPEASLSEAYAYIHDVLANRGFKLQHSGVYFGTHDVTAVDCVLATQELAANLDWFAASVKSIRMLRIEENTDLASAITIQDAVTAGLSGDQNEKPLRKRMSAWRETNPLPSPTGLAADKAFFDDLSGEPSSM